MTNSARPLRARRGAILLALAALIGSGLAAPLTSPAFAAEPEVPTEPLISTGSSWKYLDDNTDPAGEDANREVWAAPEFDDSGWKQAVSGFGVKNNALGAVGGFTPATKLEHYIDGSAKPTIPTYFFRTTFDVPEGVLESIEGALATVVHDDAVRVYVNGEKVAGFVDERVDDTAESNLQYAGSSAGDPATNEFAVPAELLTEGENTIAVALYQDRESSSDAYFDLPSLTLTPTPDEGENGVVVAAPTRVILTPTETPEVSQSFSWLAGHESHEAGQVEIGLAAGDETRLVDATPVGAVIGNPLQHFSATVDGLAPATAYRYRVGLPGSWSEWFEFTTADPSQTDFQFVYYGDAQIGLDTTWPGVVAQAEAQAPRSIGSVHAGDLINTSSNDTEWRNWFAGMERSATSTNVMAAPGNHEYSGDKLLTSWKAHFEYPLNQPRTETIGELAALAQGESDVARQYAAYFAHWADFAAETVYYADYQGVRFITLNATRDTAFLTPDALPACAGDECPSGKVQRLWTEYQAAWLDFVLKSSPSKWNVVTFHQPVYSTSSGRDEPVLREYWVPVFEENDIDLVLMGHDHTYARGYHNADATDTVGLTSGPVYAVSNSGAKHYSLESEERNVWTNNGATQVLRGERVTTYQVIDVTEDQLVYRSYVAEKAPGAASYALVPEADGDRPVYAERAVPEAGEVFDEVTITKYADDQKWITESGIEAPAGPEIGVDVETVEAGGAVTLSGSGFAAGAEIAVELRSEPVALGTVAVDETGAFSMRLVVPADTAVGDHTLAAVLPNGRELQLPLRVTEAPGEGGDQTDGAADGSDGASEGASEGGTDGSAASADADGAAEAGVDGAEGAASADSSGTDGTAEAGASADGGAAGSADADGAAATASASGGAQSEGSAAASGDAGSGGSGSGGSASDGSGSSGATAGSADAAATPEGDAAGPAAATDAGSAADPGGSDGGSGDAPLASTGAAGLLPLGVAAGSLVLLGAAVLVARRRRVEAP